MQCRLPKGFCATSRANPVPNIKLVLEYNGAGFCGWQAQPGMRTVETELRRVLEVVLREKIGPIQASGRTDSGVHARGQVINFKLENAPDLGRLARAVSSLLRHEVTVHSAEIVPDDFHSRRSARSKQYTYTIYTRNCPPVLDRERVWFVPRKLDLAAMKAAATQLIGLHDFSSFRDSECGAPDPEKEIFESELRVDLPYLYYRVVGDGFLKQMVRNIVGTLVAVGDGRLALSIPELFAARDRKLAGVTAPAHGLCLDWVSYE